MTRSNAKKEGFTNIAKMYGYWCYVKETGDSLEIKGTNKWRHFCIKCFLWLQINVFGGPPHLEDHGEL